MHAKRHAAALLIPLILLASILSACATTPYRVESNDPFSRQLDSLDAKRHNAQAWMLASAISLGVGVGSGTTFSTLASLGSVQPPASTIGLISSYSLSLLAIGVGIWSFLRYNKATNDYLGTLRLETQYYNLLTPPLAGN